MSKQTVKVQDPFTKAVIEVEIPTIVVCRTYEDCVVMLIMDADPAKCARFRGNLADEPEIREYLKEVGHKIIQMDVGSDGTAKTVPARKFC